MLETVEVGGSSVVGGAVHRGEDEEHHADRDGADAEDQQRVRRTDDLDVEAVGVVPPVVEGRGGEHRDASPGGEEDAERGAQAEDLDGGGAQLRDRGRRCTATTR